MCDTCSRKLRDLKSWPLALDGSHRLGCRAAHDQIVGVGNSMGTGGLRPTAHEASSSNRCTFWRTHETPVPVNIGTLEREKFTLAQADRNTYRE